MNEYLQATPYFNYKDQKVVDYFDSLPICSNVSAIENAIAIYYAVRDDFAYDTTGAFDGAPTLTAEFCFNQHQGYCLPKSALMIALCRKVGIPARIGLADVKNHLANPKLLEQLKTDVFSMHGYVDLFLAGKWVKATPAFDKNLCARHNISPLEFDGLADSIFHEFTGEGDKHMEYLVDHGTFAEMPVKFIQQNFAKHYPHLAHCFQNDVLSTSTTGD
ncbi:transglutaminase family protein [Thalassotalea sp. LPB0316]|uniref:transglutaminase-like domain-containing protein n=1 Tax=Thalassotalea sp. LPB0316 TaxID=2769490 RepID=UPI001865ECBF|nr:transglutaminase family protein [Thalassotalea sp. LPB0316]QOL25847.1 transglutaminase family protein [Thalassotalea sp. LPB0316]